jgi:hypothetical protein
MPRFVDTVHTPATPERAFEYMAGFDSVQEWDPSVVEARALDDRAGPGARFRVVVRVLGRNSEFVYETIEHEPSRRLVLRAETGSVVSLDTVTVAAAGDGADVTYDACLDLKGAMRLADLPMRLLFSRLGRNAREGLSRELGRVGRESP